jgi:hypothetical protein
MTTKVTGSVLANTSVVAGTYGTASQVPIITIDAQGRITSATAATVSGAGAGVGATSYTVTKFTATAGQTVFTVNYTVGYVQVYLNGVLLDYATDFTASNGTSITLATAAALDDIITVYAFSVSAVANITGGAAGAVLYQSAANTTSNTDVGTSGQLLVSGGSGKPVWIAQTALSIANTQVTGLITNAQIASVANTKITGLITSPQIATVANTQITGLITAPQIAPSAIPAGGFSNMQAFTSTTPGQTFSVPPTTTKLKVTVVGGGGGGAGSFGWSGGGGGGTMIRVITGLAGGNTIPVTVGAGGPGGPAPGGTGGSGGTSSFGVFGSATGGAGGAGIGAGGGGGIGSGGTLNIRGGGGTPIGFCVSGPGGSSSMGGGGSNAGPGGAYGGGGADGAPGGAGAAGVVVVEW